MGGACGQGKEVGARAVGWGVDLLAVSMCQQQVPRPCTQWKRKSERGGEWKRDGRPLLLMMKVRQIVF